MVTYSWYRFVDQPAFQQYNWSAEKRAKLHAVGHAAQGQGSRRAQTRRVEEAVW
jgi:hypothetical protein